MYSEDTFLHLTVPGCIGLIYISLFLSAFTVGIYWKISIRFELPIKLLLALVFTWMFIWISPQAYYFYYIQIISDLPLQNVIQTSPSFSEVSNTIAFSGQSNLSNHGKGIVFWAMMLIALKDNIHGHKKQQYKTLCQATIKSHTRTFRKLNIRFAVISKNR